MIIHFIKNLLFSELINIFSIYWQNGTKSSGWLRQLFTLPCNVPYVKWSDVRYCAHKCISPYPVCIILHAVF